MPVIQVPLGEEVGPGGLPNLLKEEEKEEDEEEKKEDSNDEEDMKGKRRDEEDMQDSLGVEEGNNVKFSLVPFATYLLPLKLLQPEEFKQPHWRDKHRPTS